MTGNNEENEVAEEEELVVEEVASPHIIETGDQVKVKQVLDDALMATVVDYGLEANYSWENLKLLLMFLSCVFAMVAQFYPLPFPTSRPLLFVCCACYFLISGILQAMVILIDKDTIMFTKPKPGVIEHDLRIRTTFTRFQDFYHFIIQYKDPSMESKQTTGKMYVGKYFTAKGEFDEDGFASDVKRHLEQFLKGNFAEIEYNHKLD